jgi:hypothetical protein
MAHGIAPVDSRSDLVPRWLKHLWGRPARGGVRRFSRITDSRTRLAVAATDVIAAHDVGSITGPPRAAHLRTAREAVRTQLLALGAGLFAAGALIFTARNFTLSRQTFELTRQTFELTEQGQVMDRYTKAVEQLGSDKLDVRMGTIYALRRFARDSARDHPTVMEVLAAFIREHSRKQWPLSDPDGTTQEGSTRPDIQAALAIIGRRDPQRDAVPIDLTGANLTEANLAEANLAEANLSRANLSRANLHCANLEDARLSESDPIPEGWLRDPKTRRLSKAAPRAKDAGP